MTTYPSKTKPSTTAITRRRLNLWIDIALTILFAVTILSLPASRQNQGNNAWDAIHCIAGSLMFIGCTFHLVLHERWIKAVVLNTPKNLTTTIQRKRKLFFGLLASLTACEISGLVGLTVTTHVPSSHLWHGLHILSGVIFLGLSIYHMVLHRS